MHKVSSSLSLPVHIANYLFRLIQILFCLLGPMSVALGNGYEIKDVNGIETGKEAFEAIVLKVKEALKKEKINSYKESSEDTIDKIFKELEMPLQCSISKPISIKILINNSDSSLNDMSTEERNIGKQENIRVSKRKYAQMNFNPMAPKKSDTASMQQSVSYLTKEEFDSINQLTSASESLNNTLCRKLACDALKINTANKSLISSVYKTCFCVLIAKDNSLAQKLAFCNGTRANITKTMRDKAEALGYQLIPTTSTETLESDNQKYAHEDHPMHAEMRALEYCLSQEGAQYILGMGCSRKHCKECDCCMQLVLGKNYHGFTAITSPEETETLPQVDTEPDWSRIKLTQELPHVVSGSKSEKVVRQQNRYSLAFYLFPQLQDIFYSRLEIVKQAFFQKGRYAYLTFSPKFGPKEVRIFYHSNEDRR